jgi:hypothetical protein
MITEDQFRQAALYALARASRARRSREAPLLLPAALPPGLPFELPLVPSGRLVRIQLRSPG